MIMAFDGRQNKLRRRDAVGMEELIGQFIREMKLSSGLNRQRAAEIWSEVSGAGKYTLSVILDKGVMTCSISSSLVRNQLYFQRDVLLQKINERLSNDSIFVFDPEKGPAVKTLILR